MEEDIHNHINRSAVYVGDLDSNRIFLSNICRPLVFELDLQLIGSVADTAFSLRRILIVRAQEDSRENSSAMVNVDKAGWID
jgi:hypothetical protein